ncbi:MAG: sensor histidine kinase [Bacteroidota bacterium]
MEALATQPKVGWSSVTYPFKSFWVFLLVNLGCGVVVTLLFSAPDHSSALSFTISSLGSAVIFLTQWMGHAYIAIWLSRKVSWLEQPMKRFFLSIVTMVVYTVVAFVAVSLLLRVILSADMPDDLLQWTIDRSVLPLIISFGIGWILAARGFYQSWKSSELRARQLNTEMLNYRYEALRNQINPHFLFNSFNVLSDLVYEDQDMAVKFIRQMSDLYRYVLDSRERSLVPLKEELEFIRSFVFLLETRFEEKLRVAIEVEPRDGEMIVPMTLQLLIENAVKHNMATKKKPLHVKVVREGAGIVVRNNLQRRSVGDESKKIGLKNMEQQYAHLSDQKIDVRETSEAFRVWVPILENQAA